MIQASRFTLVELLLRVENLLNLKFNIHTEFSLLSLVYVQP